MNTIFFILSLFCEPIDNANKLTIQQEYEQALVALSRTVPTATNHKQYCYLMAANYFALNHKTEAAHWIAQYNDSFATGTRRYDTLIYIMGNNIKTWKEGDLADIERDMRKSASRLEVAKAGKGTQEVQKQIIEKLDKLIKQQEQKANGGGEGGDGDGEDGEGNEKGSARGQRSPLPMEDSQISGGSGPGKVDQKQLRKYAEQWGGLPPAKRAAVLKEIEMQVPKKYQPLIEEYLKSLSRVRK